MKNKNQFFNAHNHTYGSFLDGMSKPEEYAQRALELGQPCITSTDHGNLHTLMATYKSAKKLGIPFMPGIEAYRARKSRFDTDQEEMSGPSINEWGQRGPYHQTILAYNNVGYVNLMKLSSAAFLEGFARKPRVDLELIERYSEGLVVLSGCLSGALQQALLRGDYEAALAEAGTMQGIVGKDNYFIEIMDHGIPEEKAVHEGLVKIAKAIDAPIVPTCDSHYTHRHDHDDHDILLCISTASQLTTPNRFKFSGDEFYLKSYEEMVDLFPKEWVHNTLLIPEKLDLNIDLDSHHYPVFEIPEESPIKVIPDYFIQAIMDGAEQRFGLNWKTERRDVAERLNTEVKIIQEMGYDSYFLIVADIIKWCLENGILIGPGRGSSASSLVSYCLGITHINPLEYGLLFERFLTPGRVPDIDVDVDSRYRDKVLDYIRNKYGHEKTAQIITISQLKAKSCINDVARVMGFPFNFSQDIVKTMPPAQFGVTKTLDECLEAEEFSRIYNEDPDVKKVIDVGKKLENLWRSDGIHAGGIIIADDIITNYCPIKQKGPGEPVVTQWDMRTVEEVGLLKIDMLGLTTLDIIQDTINRVKKVHGIEIGPPYELVENPDPLVFDSLSRGNTAQVFQMGSDGLTNLAKAMGINSVKDIMAALALYRPGPMGSGFHHSYAKRKRGKQKPIPLHPLLGDVLKDTYGILLYQEQVMAVAKEIAGFDPTAANKFLKSIGKKDREAMAATKGSFTEGCVANGGISQREAEELFAAIEPHADYSFSAAHASVYAYLSYITAYLKYYYPAEFSAACLTSEMFGDGKKFRPVLNDVREKIGVEVTPPSVNYSGFDFTTSEGRVLFSISGLKGIGETKSSSFVNFREESGKSYKTITDFFINANTKVIDKTFVEAMVYSGAFDELISDELVEDIDVEISEQLVILNKENEYLGLAVTDDPFAIYYNSLTFDKVTSPVSDVTAFSDKIRFCGLVKDPEVKVSKAGKKYAKFRVEDGSSIIQALILGKQVEFIESKLKTTLEELLQPGAFISFYCRLQERDEEESVIYITSIVDVHTPKTIDDLLTSISLKVENQNELVIINKILLENPGNKKVYILNKHPDAKLYLKSLSPHRIDEAGEKLLDKYIQRKK
jgi:DNA polymerase-3 subunit alpha